jgi:hypothetical protein
MDVFRLAAFLQARIISTQYSTHASRGQTGNSKFSRAGFHERNGGVSTCQQYDGRRQRQPRQLPRLLFPFLKETYDAEYGSN